MPTETVLESNDIETVAPARVGDTLGYARVSKADGSQSLDLQREALRAEGIDDPANLYHDFASGGRDDRPGLDSCVRDADPNDLERALQGSGAEIVGSAGSLMRARLPGDEARLQQIAALPQVEGLGAVPRESKLAPAFANQVPGGSPEGQMPVFITLMTDDPDGRWRRALEDLGAVVGRFDPDIRIYSANVSRAALEAIAAADFVLSIEPIGIVVAAHDTAVPAMGADALRRFDGTPGLFSGIGGASVPIGVMDTGLNINHLDIASNRQSICGGWWECFPTGPRASG